MPLETIHIPLLGEGTAVWRPVAAERLPDGIFRILGEMPDDEEWTFKPGEMVVVRQHIFSDGMERMVADRLVIDHTCEFQNWGAVEQSIDRAIAKCHDPFDPATISNVRDLLGVIRTQCLLPKGVAKGYWSTIRIWWEGVEVEVFDDHYELYWFTDGHTDIEHFDRVAWSDVPTDLLNQLARIAKLSD